MRAGQRAEEDQRERLEKKGPVKRETGQGAESVSWVVVHHSKDKALRMMAAPSNVTIVELNFV